MEEDKSVRSPDGLLKTKKRELGKTVETKKKCRNVTTSPSTNHGIRPGNTHTVLIFVRVGKGAHDSYRLVSRTVMIKHITGNATR